MQNLDEFETLLGYRFKNKGLLKNALTHKSAKRTKTHNERLEFLGDAVLDLIVGEYLYMKFPKLPEGELSKMRASMVNEKAFASVARELNIGQHIIISHSEELNEGRKKDSIISSAYEAIIGAIYLESGLEKARKIACALIERCYPEISPAGLFCDYKTALQEVTQARFGMTPEYILLDSIGPDHKREFLMSVQIQGKEYAKAHGKSKKAAQQACAKAAMEALESEQGA